jgi:hypothetical protein
VNAALFLEYINDIFIPYLKELRESKQFHASEAVLLMDNCSFHISEKVIPVLTNARVRVITFAPHTTHISQMLDVVLFGALKKRASGLEMWNKESDTAAFILRLYHDFKQTMVEMNMSATFQPLGSLMTLPKIRIHCFSTRKSSDKVAGSWNSRCVTRPWRVCRRGVNTPSLDVLTNPSKWMWSKKFVVLLTRNKDMQPTN